MNLTVPVETDREMIAVRLPAGFHSHLSTREVSNHRSDCWPCFCSRVFATPSLPPADSESSQLTERLCFSW
jgi:hypothetical protein